MNRKVARAQAEKLVAQMTLEEKAAQLKYDAPAIPRLGVPAFAIPTHHHMNIPAIPTVEPLEPAIIRLAFAQLT